MYKFQKANNHVYNIVSSILFVIIEEKKQENKGEDAELSYEYELIGVTVHTGTADGGHYYSFIRDRIRDKWFLFNDAEVKPFDPKQIAAECFGGEMTVISTTVTI